MAVEESSVAAATITDTFKNIVFFSGPIDEPAGEEEAVEHSVCHSCFKCFFANTYVVDSSCATESTHTGGQSSK
jgi:hypothetical protein